MKLYYNALSGLIDDPHLYSTIRAGQVDPESGETVEALYDNAAQYCGDISQWLKAFQTEDYPIGDLMQYLHWTDDPQVETEIRRKIRSAHVTVEASGDLLYARLDLDMTKDLTVLSRRQRNRSRRNAGLRPPLRRFSLPKLVSCRAPAWIR